MAAEIKAAIEAEIESGTLPPGALLDERTLAERFGVSRTPVREALQQLAAQNLVRIAPRVGVFVSRLSITQLRETLELLGELEAVAAKLAARRMDDEQRASLEASMAQCVEASNENNGKQFAEANATFHDLIYAGSHNEYLAQQIHSIRRLMQRYRPKIFLTPAQRQKALQDHRKLADAILHGDEVAAHDAMLQHAPVGTTGFSEFLSTLPASYLEGESGLGSSPPAAATGAKRSRGGVTGEEGDAKPRARRGLSRASAG
ncbi:GntR family transcriptional regulator [Cupriavidus basilensis]|nr:GntR family transcriptional regulator [Cupriavidus basilensis]